MGIRGFQIRRRGRGVFLYRRLPSLPYRGFPNPQAVRRVGAPGPRTGPPIKKSAIQPVGHAERDVVRPHKMPTRGRVLCRFCRQQFMHPGHPICPPPDEPFRHWRSAILAPEKSDTVNTSHGSHASHPTNPIIKADKPSVLFPRPKGRSGKLAFAALLLTSRCSTTQIVVFL